MIKRTHFGPNFAWQCSPTVGGLYVLFSAPDREVVHLGQFDTPIHQWMAVKDLVRSRGLKPGPPPWEPTPHPYSF